MEKLLTQKVTLNSVEFKTFGKQGVARVLEIEPSNIFIKKNEEEGYNLYQTIRAKVEFVPRHSLPLSLWEDCGQYNCPFPFNKNQKSSRFRTHRKFVNLIKPNVSDEWIRHYENTSAMLQKRQFLQEQSDSRESS